MTIYYFPIEPYKERYTGQLLHWTENTFKRQGIDFVTVTGDALADDISSGVVLDVHNRCHYSLTQVAKFSRIARSKHITCDDVVYFQDMFTPGYEAIPYMFQAGDCPRIFARCWAQSVDIYDFTYNVREWMRQYEFMVDRTAAGIFVANEELGQLLRMAMFQSNIYNVGLPFSSDEVLQFYGGAENKSRRVLFSSRLDAEKQPGFFFDLAEQMFGKDVIFAVCTSAKELRSNDEKVIKRLLLLAEAGVISIYTGLSKMTYYKLLSGSSVQFNCALQDWVSFTALEASTYGVTTVAPAFRGFLETYKYSPDQLYKPWDLTDAERVVTNALDGKTIVSPIHFYHDETLEREVKIMMSNV